MDYQIRHTGNILNSVWCNVNSFQQHMPFSLKMALLFSKDRLAQIFASKISYLLRVETCQKAAKSISKESVYLWDRGWFHCSFH